MNDHDKREFKTTLDLLCDALNQFTINIQLNPASVMLELNLRTAVATVSNTSLLDYSKPSIID